MITEGVKKRLFFFVFFLGVLIAFHFFTDVQSEKRDERRRGDNTERLEIRD